jgi:gamma-glutamyltranspeptidase
VHRVSAERRADRLQQRADFDPDPDNFNPGANDPAPFKRPRSSMAPTIVYDHGRPVAAYGSPGGSSIINTVVNMTLNLVDHGFPVQEAIDRPRVSLTSASDDGAASVEEGFEDDVIAALEALGYDLAVGEIGSVQAAILGRKRLVFGSSAAPTPGGSGRWSGSARSMGPAPAERHGTLGCLGRERSSMSGRARYRRIVPRGGQD